MQNARLDEAQAGIKTAGRNICNKHISEKTCKKYPEYLILKTQG